MSLDAISAAVPSLHTGKSRKNFASYPGPLLDGAATIFGASSLGRSFGFGRRDSAWVVADDHALLGFVEQHRLRRTARGGADKQGQKHEAVQNHADYLGLKSGGRQLRDEAETLVLWFRTETGLGLIAQE